MNKFDRVISTLVLLQTRKILKATTIAERFDISLRTVYRDISTLKNAGIPIIGDPGIGYSIMDGYRLPPISFTEGEASALLTAEKFIGKLTDQETKRHYSSALMKIKAILRGSEQQTLEVLDSSIAITSTQAWDNKTYLQDLFKSIAHKQLLKIQYQKADGSNSIRDLEPIGCYHYQTNWYLVAFCRLKKDYRTFKINRIVDLTVLDEHFDRKHISLQKYIDQQSDSWKNERSFHTIVIAFNLAYVEYAEKRKYYFGFIDQKIKEDVVEMTFLNTSLEFIARWLLQFEDQAMVLQPIELKDRIKILATSLYKHYQ